MLCIVARTLVGKPRGSAVLVRWRGALVTLYDCSGIVTDLSSVVVVGVPQLILMSYLAVKEIFDVGVRPGRGTYDAGMYDA